MAGGHYPKLPPFQWQNKYWYSQLIQVKVTQKQVYVVYFRKKIFGKSQHSLKGIKQIFKTPPWPAQSLEIAIDVSHVILNFNKK